MKINLILMNAKNISILFFAFILLFYSIVPVYSNDSKKDLTSDIKEDDPFVLEGNELTIIETQEKSQDIKIITKEDVEKINPLNLADLLEKKENLIISEYGSYGNQSTIGLRGMGGKRIAILIDGVPVNSEQSGDFDLSKINVSNIEKIEIIKGGSDSKYNVSGAIGGIINIITKKKNNAGFKIYSSVSNLFYYPDFYYPKRATKKEDKQFSKWYDFFDTQHGTFGFGIGNQHVYWNTDWSGTRAFNHFIYKDEDNIKRRRIDNEIYDTFASTYLTINLPQYMRLIFSGEHYYGYKYMPGPINSTTVGKQIDTTGKGTIFFDADFIGTDRVDTEFIVSNNFTNKEWYEDIHTDSKKVTSNHAQDSINVINRWGFILADWATLRIGGDFSYTYLDSTDLGIIHSFNGGGWLTWEFSIKKIVEIIPSVKLIYYKKYPVAVPKLGFVFNINENWNIRSNFFRAYRMPALDDLYWPKQAGYEGNPNLKPEDGFGGDFILGYNKSNILSAETSLYVTYLNDAISWQSGKGGKWTPDNIGRAMYFGSDTFIKSDFSKYVILSLNYSFLLTYFLSDEVNFSDDKRMPYTPMHSIGLCAEFNWNSGQINLVAKYTSERYTTVSNVTELPGYFNIDINFSQKIKIFTIFASVKNALNNLYYLIDGYPMPGGSVTIGVKIEYEGVFKKNKNETTEEAK
jgi:vitamin B12 transporter